MSRPGERAARQQVCSGPRGRRAWSLAALLLLAAATARSAVSVEGVREGEIEQTWYRLTQALEPFDPPVLEERCNELTAMAGKVGLRRLTPFAIALVARSRSLPGEEAMLTLGCAERLDPDSPEVHLARARRYFGEWAALPGAGSALRAATAIVSDGRFTRPMVGSATLSLLAALLAGFAVWAIFAVRRVLPMLWHDLREMGIHWRLGPNGIVVAFVALTLPLFAGGDAAWLALWVFALCWGYLPTPARVTGFAGLLLVAAAPTVLELGFRSMIQNPSGVMQATAALAERRYDPQALDELDSLADQFEHSPAYYRLKGDLYRQFGLLDNAAFSYREGLRRAPDDGPLALGLGVVRYIEGDYNAALQAFQTARAAGADPVVVNYNLSLTFAQTYHFRESDEALERARKIDDRRMRRLTGDQDHQPILPLFSNADARALLATSDTVSLIHRGLVLQPVLQERTIAHPLTLAALVALVFAIGNSLIRERATGYAASCVRCGRSFCRRCRLSQDRQSYCAQCVNIFLKKDAVGIEAQIAKKRQVARHAFAVRFERRLGDVLLPGLGLGFAGRPLIGAAIGTLAVVCVAIAAVWLPLFVAPMLMSSPVEPLQIAVACIWVTAAVTAQVLPRARS